MRESDLNPRVGGTAWPDQLMLPRQVAAPAGPVDMAMMYIAHHAFRRDLEMILSGATRTPTQDRSTWRALLRRWEYFSIALHHHHQGEDDWLWPVLLQRASGKEVALLEAMEREHQEIDPALAACASGLTRLADADDPHARDALVAQLTATRDAIHRHLAHEESDTMSLLQRVLAPGEWEAVDEKFKRSFAPTQLSWLVPWMVADLPTHVRDAMFQQPGTLPLRVVYRLFRGRHARLERAAFKYVSTDRSGETNH